MRRVARFLPAVTLSLLLVGGAFGQGFGGRGQGFRGFGGGMLLMAPDVQTELKLTDAQKGQVRDAMQKLQASMQGLGARLQNATPEERAEMFQKLQADQQKAFNGILNTDQQKRLHQIELQLQGPSAIGSPEVAGELKLTDEQKQKVGGILQQQQDAMRQLFQGGFTADARDKMQAIRKDTDTKIAAVLTPEQQQQWKEMQGAAFTLRSFPGGPGFSGRPGPRGGVQPAPAPGR